MALSNNIFPPFGTIPTEYNYIDWDLLEQEEDDDYEDNDGIDGCDDEYDSSDYENEDTNDLDDRIKRKAPLDYLALNNLGTKKQKASNNNIYISDDNGNNENRNL